MSETGKDESWRCGDCDGTGKFWSPLVGWVDDDVCGWCRGTGFHKAHKANVPPS